MRHGVVAAILLIGCAGDGSVAGKDGEEPGPDGGSDPIGQGDPEVPPQGHTAIKAWLAAGHYESWACEDAPHAARPPGAHGTNRICSNAALSASANGNFPVGAASVKELWQNGAVTGYAVGRKIADGSAASSWYWYEAYGDSVIADGPNKGICVNCHAGAPRDYVFTQVR